MVLHQNLNLKKQKLIFLIAQCTFFVDGITEIKDAEGKKSLESPKVSKNYIKKYQEVPNNERLNKIIEDIIKSGRIQKDDLTIVVVDGK